jgi:hypothetical protein
MYNNISLLSAEEEETAKLDLMDNFMLEGMG